MEIGLECVLSNSWAERSEEQLMVQEVKEGILILFTHLFHAFPPPEFQPPDTLSFLLNPSGLLLILFSLLLLKEINPVYSLEGRLLKLTLQNFGHLM